MSRSSRHRSSIAEREHERGTRIGMKNVMGEVTTHLFGQSAELQRTPEPRRHFPPPEDFRREDRQ
jgi:hypothetical protein